MFGCAGEAPVDGSCDGGLHPATVFFGTVGSACFIGVGERVGGRKYGIVAVLVKYVLQLKDVLQEQKTKVTLI